MDDHTAIYNSRGLKIFIDYLQERYPSVDIGKVLSYAGIAHYALDDPGHCFNQLQIDRFHEILVQKTGDSDIAYSAGRFATSSKGVRVAKQYLLGLLSLSSIYLLMGKLYPIISRGAEVSARKLGPDRIEITSIPKAGVNEKSYQCRNRIGFFESLGKLFTPRFASVEHPECFHRGNGCCRYIVTWEPSASMMWKRLRNMAMLITLSAAGLGHLWLPFDLWPAMVLGAVCLTAGLSLVALRAQNCELQQTLEIQGNAAKGQLDEVQIRYHNALLVQEVGQATANILDIDRFLGTVVNVMQKHLDFDRGMIMLTNSAQTHLVYTAGFGYDPNKEALLNRTSFHLDNPDSQGIFVLAYRQHRSYLVNDIDEIKHRFSQNTRIFITELGVRALICVPIAFKHKCLGILAVDNIRSKRVLTQSDMNLLRGVASQTAVGITNALSFGKLQESERKYRELVENANSIIMRTDIHGHITFFNEFAQQFFGYSETEINGRNVNGTILPAAAAGDNAWQQLLERLQAQPEQPLAAEMAHIRRNSEPVWINWTYRPIFDSQQQLAQILCIGNDITELKQSQEEKKELGVQLLRAQKMEAIGTLAGGVAHDLNNILSGFVSYPQLLLMQLAPESPLRKPLQTIQKSGERAAAVVQDLLTLARRGVGATEVVDLNRTVAEFLSSPEYLNLKSVSCNLEIDTTLASERVCVVGSPVHLTKTIMNLVFNAAEAMPRGGKITLSTIRCRVEQSRKGFEEVPPGDYVALTVADSGIGIPQTDIERIFEPFYTKKTMGRSGTGLGMAVVWGTVKDHHGFIEVTSRLNHGTVFRLFFPACDQLPKQGRPHFDLARFTGRGESILVVDDVASQRQIATEILDRLGYRTTAVDSGEAALEYLHHHTAQLLLLDMMMEPGMDGLETFRQALRLDPHQKAVIVSGFSETSRIRKAQNLGAGAFLKKPYALEKLGLAVRTELDR